VFRRHSPLDLESILEFDEIVTCPPIVQEVLQGFRDERAFRIARESMLAFPMVDSPLPLDRFHEAANVFRAARRAGVTVRSSVDCLIAAVAIAHDLEVMHQDRDFDQLALVSPLRTLRAR
jgi:predicted nucleic acid-binding protein